MFIFANLVAAHSLAHLLRYAGANRKEQYAGCTSGVSSIRLYQLPLIIMTTIHLISLFYANGK